MEIKVNNKHLDFSNILNSVLYWNFCMPLPPTFKKVNAEDTGNKHAGEDKEVGGKKKKVEKSEKKKENLVAVKNTNQHKAFKMREGKSWKQMFTSKNMNERPSWNGDKSTKMCVRYHVLGKCFKSCNRKESHKPKDQIPADKVVEMCAFIAKYRGE